MNAILIAVITSIGFIAAYFLYGRFLSRKIFELFPTDQTPAHQMEDGVDFVPTNRFVLFGHHFASIAGLGPIIGPAIAVYYGWLPALLWVFFGTIFLGAVHDLGALAISLKNQGRSIGDLSEEMFGRRGRILFLLATLGLLAVVLAVFAAAVGGLFAEVPQAIVPTLSLIVISIMIGFLLYRTRFGLGPATILGLVLMGVSLYFGHRVGDSLPLVGAMTASGWVIPLMIYAFFAAVLPVWVLLQPRDYLNSFGLYLGIILMYLGLIISNPQISAPAVDVSPAGAPPLFPFIFILVACGAISGFHSLVSSGTTSKQLDKQSDALFIGYGGMLTEGALAVVVIIACTAGLGGLTEWRANYGEWSQVKSGALWSFVQGGGELISSIGISRDFARTLMAVTVISFALTSLDSCARLLRFIISELGKVVGLPASDNRYLTTAVAVFLGTVLAITPSPGTDRVLGQVMWEAFGMANQALAALGLLTVTMYLVFRHKPAAYTFVPMAFMVLVTCTALVISLEEWIRTRNWILAGIGTLTLITEVWLIIEGILAYIRFRSQPEVPVPAVGAKAGEATTS